MKKLFVIALLSVLTACGSQAPYPYIPQFISEKQVPLPSLSAPPSQSSATYAHELDVIVERQSHLSAKEKQAIYDERNVTPEMMVTPTLGAGVNEATRPALFLLLRHAGSDSWRISDMQKDYWHTLRPWMADKRVHLYVPTITSPGYPSGHTVTNFVWAAILGDIWPEKRAVFDMRAETIGMHRIDGGAHFFHDIEGGKQLAKLIYQAMSENGNYRQELADAQAEAAKLDKPKKAAKKKKAPLASPTSNRRKAA